jgi:hypothetical protein
MRVAFIHKATGVKIWVTESEVEKFKAAGYKLAAEPKSEKPIMNKPEVKEEQVAKPVKKVTAKRGKR